MKPLYTQTQFDEAKCRELLPLECEYCGRIFYKRKNRIQVHIKRNYDKCFCCKACSDKFRDTRVDIICEQCGSTVKSRGLYKGSKHTFCSQSCSAKYNNVKRVESGFYDELKRKRYLKKTTDSAYIKKEINKVYTRKCKHCSREFISKSNRRNTCYSIYCSKTRVVPALVKYFGFDKSTVGTSNYPIEFQRIVDMISNWYDNGWSMQMIANKVGHTNIRNFSKIMESLGLKRRSLSDAFTLSVLEGRHDAPVCAKFKTGYHTTWNGKRVFYRSSYELECALLLDRERVDYDMEKLRFTYFDTQKNKVRVAIPDFFIPCENLIVEIKSEYTLDKINMKDKIKSYVANGYDILVLVDWNDMTSQLL